MLTEGARLACSSTIVNAPWTFTVGEQPALIAVRTDSQVLGFLAFLQSGHQSVVPLLKAHWEVLLQRGIIVSTLSGGTQGLVDVLHFVTSFAKERRRSRRRPSPAAERLLMQFRVAFLTWLSVRIDEYLGQTHSADNPAVHQPPPALNVRRGSGRQYISISAEAAWNTMLKAREARANLEQAIVLNRDVVGCHQSAGDVWQNKLLQMYQVRCSLLWCTPAINHWNIVADPGRHSYNECLVSLAYAWEIGQGCYPEWQNLLPGGAINDDEVEMLDIVEAKRREDKLQRVAAYRQMAGISHQISLLSKRRLTVDSFELPSSCNVRPVTKDEKRVVIPEGDRALHLIENTVTGVRVSVLPFEVTDVLLLVLMLDQGGIGLAGVVFATYFLKKLTWVKFDKVHRIIRDLKLAEQDVLDGVFNKTKLWSSYLLGLNNRPFNSGANSALKARLLELFMLQGPIDKPIFTKYLNRLSKAWGMPCDTLEDKELILARLAELRSFTHKLGSPKASNWFAWHKQMYEHGLDDFYATKMIFEDQLPNEPDPDANNCFASCGPARQHRAAAAQLQGILKAGGGIRLAYKLMSDELHQNEKILYVAEQSSWSWYTTELEDTKTPQQAVHYSVRMSEGRWMAEQHVAKTFELVCRDPANLRLMEIPEGESHAALKAVSIAWGIAGKRLWTLTKHSYPPESYAGILPAEPNEAERSPRVATLLRSDHIAVIDLEELSHRYDDAQQLRKDIVFLDAPAIRIIFEMFARDQYSPTSTAGLKILMGLLCTLPDNKSVEDIHQPLRLEARANTNKKLSSNHIQEVIIQSGVLEKRGVKHLSKVTKEHFCRHFKSTKKKKLASHHKSRYHKLPKHWSRMLHPVKTWHTVSEPVYERAAAAWSWLRAFRQGSFNGAYPAAVRLGTGRLARFMVPECLVVRNSDNKVFVSFGNAGWAALAWPMDAVALAGAAGGVCYKFHDVGPCVWLHITDLSAWSVKPWVAVRRPGLGIVLEQRGEQVSLLKHCLSCKADLHCADLELCVEHLGIESTAADLGDGEALLGKLCEYVAPGDATFLARARLCYLEATSKREDRLLKDPSWHLLEAVYEDLDPDDKSEFKEIAKAKELKKLRHAHVLASRKRWLGGAGPSGRKRARVAAVEPPPEAADAPPPVGQQVPDAREVAAVEVSGVISTDLKTKLGRR